MDAGSVCPPKEEVWRCLDEYLDNMKLENCDMNEEVVTCIQKTAVIGKSTWILKSMISKRRKGLIVAIRIIRAVFTEKKSDFFKRSQHTHRRKPSVLIALGLLQLQLLHQDETASYRFLNLKRMQCLRFTVL